MPTLTSCMATRKAGKSKPRLFLLVVNAAFQMASSVAAGKLDFRNKSLAASAVTKPRP